MRPYEGVKPTATQGHGSHRRRAQSKHTLPGSPRRSYSELLSPAVSGKGLRKQPLAVESEAYPLRAARHPTASVSSVRCLTATRIGVSLALLRPMRDGIAVNTVDSVAELTLYVSHPRRESHIASIAEEAMAFAADKHCACP